MVDGINFNPFSGKVFTTDEIKKLDQDKDGKITFSELEANSSWLSGGVQDEEGEVQIGAEAPKTEAAESTETPPATGAVNNENNQEYSKILDTLIDTMSEVYAQSNDKTATGQYSTRLQNIKNEFLKTYTGDADNLVTEFNAYVKTIDVKTDAAMTVYSDIANADGAEAYGKIKESIQKAGSYISIEEKANIANTTADFIINQLANGNTEMTILNDVMPGYEDNAKFMEAKKLIDNIKTSVNPEEDLAKAKQLLSEMIQEVGVDKLAEGVENKRTPAVTFSSDDRSELTSMIPGYDANAPLVSGRKKSQQAAKDEVQNQAKSMLESLRPQLLEQMKTKLGADYDEATANKLIDNAMYQAITEASDQDMNMSRKKSIFLSRRTASLNIRTVVDKFLDKVELLSADGAKQVDKAANPVSLTDVVSKSGVADKYQDNKTKHVSGRAQAKLEVKEQINLFANQLKAMLKEQLGSDYDASKINSYINQATNTTLDSIQDNNKSHSIMGHFYRVSTRNIVDTFYSEFNKLYEAQKK